MAEAGDDIKDRTRPYRAGFILLLASAFLFRLWFNTTLPLSGDEAYHWEWSRHLAFGYYDHPGLTAYLIRACTLLCGASTEFSVRLAALLMLTGSAIVAYLAARRVMRSRQKDPVVAEQAGFLAGLLVLFAPLFAFFAGYISTDPPVIFASTLTVYGVLVALQTGRWSAWLAAGVAAGLAMLAKFLAFLIFPGMLLFLLLSPEDRAWFRRPQPYVAALVGLLTFSPCLYWNATHGWATFMFNFVYRQEDNAFAPWHALEYVGSQMLALSPGVFIVCVVALVWAFREWRRSRDRALLFLGLTSALPLLYFLATGLRRTVGPHWPAPGWVPALILAACYMVEPGSSRRKRRWSVIVMALCVGGTIALYPLAHIPARWVHAVSWRYAGSPDRISTEKLNERYGWEDLGQRVGGILREMREQDGRDVFVFSGQYGLSAAISFYSPEPLYVHLWAPRRVHGENYRFWDDFASLKGRNGLYVSKDEARAAGMGPELRRYFTRVDRVERIGIMQDGSEVRAFFAIRCYGFNGEAPQFSRHAW